MAGKPKRDPQKTQAEEIAQLEVDCFAYSAALPVQKLAADVIGRPPDTIQDRVKADHHSSARCSRATADWAKKETSSRRIREDWLLDLGIAGILREVAR